MSSKPVSTERETTKEEERERKPRLHLRSYQKSALYGYAITHVFVVVALFATPKIFAPSNTNFTIAAVVSATSTSTLFVAFAVAIKTMKKFILIAALVVCALFDGASGGLLIAATGDTEIESSALTALRKVTGDAEETLIVTIATQRALLGIGVASCTLLTILPLVLAGLIAFSKPRKSDRPLMSQRPMDQRADSPGKEYTGHAPTKTTRRDSDEEMPPEQRTARERGKHVKIDSKVDAFSKKAPSAPTPTLHSSLGGCSGFLDLKSADKSVSAVDAKTNEVKSTDGPQHGDFHMVGVDPLHSTKLNKTKKSREKLHKEVKGLPDETAAVTDTPKTATTLRAGSKSVSKPATPSRTPLSQSPTKAAPKKAEYGTLTLSKLSVFGESEKEKGLTGKTPTATTPKTPATCVDDNDYEICDLANSPVGKNKTGDTKKSAVKDSGLKKTPNRPPRK